MLAPSLRSPPVFGLFILCFSGLAVPALAQQQGGAYLPRDDQLDALLAQAREFEAEGRAGEAARAYLLAEDRLEERRREDPTARIVVPREGEVFEGAERAIRARLRSARPGVLEAYRATREPRAAELFERAVGRPFDPAPLEEIAARYPLTSVGARALERLADLRIERGQFRAALGALEERAAEAAAGLPAPAEVAARIEWLRARLAARPAGERAGWPMAGGGPDRSCSLRRSPAPGAAVFTAALPLPEVSGPVIAGFARRGLRPPLVSHPAVAGGSILVADSKSVVSIGADDGKIRWIFVAIDDRPSTPEPPLLPERLENMAYSVAAEGGRVFATLNRNTPPIWPAARPAEPRGPRAAAEVSADQTMRRKDYRLVALDLASGRLLWDASAGPDLEDLARNARYVTPPLAASGRVYFGATTAAQGNLQSFAIALDAATGKLLWRTFVCAGTPDDFCGLAAEGAPLSIAGQRLVVETNLGAVATLDPEDGSFLWANRYRATPASSQKRMIRDGLRFTLAPPRVVGGVAIAAPQDSGYVHAFDLRSGEEVWRYPRDRARTVAGVSNGCVILAGDGVLEAVEGASGRTRWETALPPGELRAEPSATEERVYVPAADRLLVFDAATGKLSSTLRFGPRGAEAGNVVALPDRLVIVSEAAVTVLEPAGRSLERLGAAAGGGEAAAVLAHGTFLARFEEVAGPDRREEAFAELRRAQDLGGPAVAADARAEAFSLARRAAEAAFAGGDEKGAVEWSGRALATVGPGPEGLVFVKAAAERFEAMGRPRDAAMAWQKALEHHRDLEVRLAPGISAPAGPFARDRLDELRRKAGASAFVDLDRDAAKLFEIAKQAGTPEAYQVILDRYPATASEPAALLALGLLHERRDLANLAIRFYARHAERYSSAPEAAKVLFKLASLLERTKRCDEERRVLEAIRDRFPNETVEGPGGPVNLAVYANSRLAALGGMDAGPALPLGAAEEPGLGRSFETWIDLTWSDRDEQGPEILTPRGLDPDQAPIFLVADQAGIEARRVETGVLLWRRSVADLRRERTGVAGGVVVLSAGRTIEAVDLETGELRWRFGAPELGKAAPGSMPPSPVAGAPAGGPAAAEGPAAEAAPPLAPEGPAPANLPGEGEPEGSPPHRTEEALRAIEASLDPDPVKGMVAAGDRAVAIVGRDVIGLEAASGRVAWRQSRTEVLAGDPIPLEPALPPPGTSGAGTAAPGSRVIVAAENPARLIAFDLASGAEVYALALGDHDPRLTTRPVACKSARRLFCVVGGSDLIGVDAVAGVQVWRRRLPFWTRELVPARDGSAVAVLTHPSADQPKLVIFEGATGATVYEERAERNRVGPVAFDGERFIIFAGDFLSGRLRSIEWRGGRERWTFAPQRGQAFSQLVVARDHLILPQTAPGGPAVVHILDRDRGTIFRSFPLEGRRIISAAVQRGTLLVSTNRGVFGFSRLDPEKLKDEIAAAAALAARAPDNFAIRSALADRRFKLGDIEGAIDVCDRALREESIGLADYDVLYRQELGFLDARPPVDRLEIRRIARAPEIDGDLRDWWPVEQSLELSNPRHVAPVQGPSPRVAVLRGKDDLSATLYLAYDERYFYFALDVDDSSLIPYDSEAEDWKGDCLLIAIDTLGDGGEYFRRDDNLLSLALTLPKKNKKPGEDEENEPEGRYFVKRKDDGSGAVYEAAVPWTSFIEHQADIDAAHGPKEGFSFGFNVVVTDDDDGRGARKALSWTPSITLHKEKRKLWPGFVPGRFGRIICR